MLNYQFTSIVHPTPDWQHVRVSTNGDGLLWLHERGFEACYQQTVSPLSFSHVPCTANEIQAQWQGLIAIRSSFVWTQERQDALWRISILRRNGDVAATITPRWFYSDRYSDRISWRLLIGLDNGDRPLPAVTLSLLELVRGTDREHSYQAAPVASLP
jgi:hypothetical protein